MELNTLYRPITSTPFRHSVSYAEFEPCAALKPYIRCFWGKKNAVALAEKLRRGYFIKTAVAKLTDEKDRA